MTTFGPIISASQVEQWVIDLADRWFTEYIAEAERQLGLPPRYYPALASLVTANDFDEFWPEEALPCLLVMNLGMAQPPSRDGRGNWSVRWLFGCSIVVSTDTRANTRRAMHDYAAAFSTMMMEHRSLEHPEAIRGTSWVDGRPDSIPAPNRDDTRRLGAAQMMFTVDVANVLSEMGVPPEPDPRPDPYHDPGNLPVIETAQARIDLVREIQP